MCTLFGETAEIKRLDPEKPVRHQEADSGVASGVAQVAIEGGTLCRVTFPAPSQRRACRGAAVRQLEEQGKIWRSWAGRFAVADLKHVRFSGFTAWLLWIGIHIYFLIGFANRLLVTLQWGISFVTKRRGVRILPLAQAEMTHADPDRQAQAT